MRGVWYVTGYGGPPAGLTLVVIAVLVFHRTIEEAIQLICWTVIIGTALTVAAVITVAVARYRHRPPASTAPPRWQPGLIRTCDRTAGELPEPAAAPRELPAPAPAPQVHIHLDHVDAATIAALLATGRNRPPAELGGKPAQAVRPAGTRSGGAHSHAGGTAASES